MADSPEIPAMPPLAKGGRTFWLTTVGKYQLSPSEFTILSEVCRTIDTLDRLDRSIITEGATITGASGQTILHPGINAAARLRLVLHKLISALALEDETGASVPTPHTIRGRTAAAARWSPRTTPRTG